MALPSPSMNQEVAAPIVSCQECQEHPAIYACPRCRRRTCSLACCRSHKKRTQCNGKRDLTAFQPLSRMTDATLQSDYHFLETVLGTIESGKKLIQQHGGGMAGRDHTYRNSNYQKRQRVESSAPPSRSPAWLPSAQPLQQSSSMSPKQRHFVQQAAQRGVTVMLQPSMMQRNQLNKSYATKQGDLFWTVEWRIHGLRSIEIDAKAACDSYYTLVQDNVDLHEALTQCMATNNVSARTDLSPHHLLLKRIPCPANQPLYSELSRNYALATCLQDRTVIEFPTIEIVPNDRLDEFPLLVQESEGSQSKQEEKGKTMDVKESELTDS